MLKKAMTVACFAALAACGSNKTTSSTTANTTGSTGTTGTASKYALNSSTMAEQATTSCQNQADQSETATSGSDDSSGTSKLTLDQSRGGFLGIHPQPGIDFNMPVAGDFNVALNFQSYVGPDSCTSDGNVQVYVQHHANGDNSIVLQGTIQQSYANGHDIEQSTDPTITIVKQGTRAGGRVVREINGIVHRTLMSADNPNADFNFLIDHNGTVVTDIYVSGSLSSRTITGNSSITDGTSGDSAVITFTNVVRPAPTTCLCPTAGTISVAYTHANATETISHAFNGTCGQVTISENLSAAAAVAAGATATTAPSSTTASATGSTTASASAATSSTSTVTWDNCIPH